MCEVCIQNFLQRSDPACVERHSDSSDFENSSPIPVVVPKSGNHSLLNGKLRNSNRGKEYKSKLIHCSKIKSFDPGHTSNYIVEQSQSTKTYKNLVRLAHYNKKSLSLKTNRNIERCTKRDYKRNRGDQSSSYYLEQNNSNRPLVKNKILPCLSQMLRRSNNHCKHLTCIKEKDSLNIKRNNNLICTNYMQNKGNKYKRQRQKYAVQPVYTVKDMNGFPLTSNQTYDRIKPTQYTEINKITSNICQSATSTTTTEEEIIRNYTYEKLLKKFKQCTQKTSKKENDKYESIQKSNSSIILFNKGQQCSSKLLVKYPYQVFTSSCQVKSSLNDAGALAKLDTNSSAFWTFLAEKVNRKTPMQKMLPILPKGCDCEKPVLPCNPETCNNMDSATETGLYNQFRPSSSSPPPSLSLTIPKKISKIFKKEGKLQCQCYPDQKEQPLKQTESSSRNEDSKPCRQNHNDITKAVAAKYQGEILCIHNPPCILINGCLNMPPPKTSTQSNLWPVTYSKKSSFVQMCRKMKRKQRGCNQSSQYHEPLTEIQQCLPEFRTEKIIQSICNHSPPCQIVHGCFKPRYDPTLANSCVHVPMCERVPECVMDSKNQGVETSMCQHSPKCAELPICSRKYIVLTAKESMSTQVYPASKIVCRHNPPCVRLPKCLANWICGGHVPWDIIPGCAHYPCCELVPACCTKSARDMVSVTSQHPTAPCRIV